MDQSSRDFFPWNAGGIAVDHISFRFWISGVVPEIFAIKVNVVKNRTEFWTFFSPSQILGGRPSKSYTHVMTPVPRHVVWKMFCGDTLTMPEVIMAKTLNFKVNFKFSQLTFFIGGTPVPLRVFAIKAWAISSACINVRAQHPLGAEICHVSLPCPVYERRRLYERTVDTGLCPPLCGLFLPGSSWSIA